MAVYVIDDDPGVNEALKVSIEALGHDVIACPDASSLFIRPPPTSRDVVLIDLELPDIPGARVIRWLLRLKDPPRIIPISALSNEYIARELQGTGMEALRKPLTHDTLAAALKPDWS